METFWTVVIVVVAFFFCTMAVFMVMEKKVEEDYEQFIYYIEYCPVDKASLDYCQEEFARLVKTGFVPQEFLDELRDRIRAKFR
jgi:hypothetical protein